jgi:hypothetical protein
MTPRYVSLLLFAAIASCGPARAWGPEGHRLVGLIAASRLTSPRARAEVHRLLGGRSLAQVGEWADQVKQLQRSRQSGGDPGPLKDDPVAEAFLADSRNAGNARWHYCDLPLGVKKYELGVYGSRRDDVVQIAAECVRVLEGASHRLPPEMALLWLVHLIGDVHQPLHVGSGYLAGFSGGFWSLLTSPKIAAQGTGDEGGNRLLIDDHDRLHYFWDITAVRAALAGKPEALKARELEGRLPPASSHPAGRPEAWPAAWAADSLHWARAAYRPIRVRSWRRDNGKLVWIVTVPPSYSGWAAGVAEMQIAQAGARLAELLDCIWPAKRPGATKALRRDRRHGLVPRGGLFVRPRSS